ncbi:MAG: alpha/beta hydrolase fold domain-containing protein [Bacteroidaceae bacterium]|nr:alpha/beta hydrolase fold domain-containing protein [Bacteroidaceae bacterium]
MKRPTLFLIIFLLCCLTLQAQQTYDLSTSPSDTYKPSIQVFLPSADKANGCAVILCPGGGMRALSWESDVEQMAAFLNERGIAAIGLKYHLNTGSFPQGMKMSPMVDVTHLERFPQADANPMHYPAGDSILQLAANDAKAAIRLVRQHAQDWHLDTHKIGYLGFSAGGGVAIAATIQATDPVERPDFLCTNFGPSLMPVQVPNPAPPLLIMTRAEHPNVAAGLVNLFLEWKKAGGNAELHLYGDGSGPYTLMPQTGRTTTESWSQQLLLWLEAKGFAKRP